MCQDKKKNHLQRSINQIVIRLVISYMRMKECIEVLKESDFEHGIPYLDKLAFRYRGTEDTHIFRHVSYIWPVVFLIHL